MPSLVSEPRRDADVHFVLCDFGRLGQAYVELDPETADRNTIIRDMLAGEYRRPVKVIALRPDGTWRDVSLDVAWAVTKAAAVEGATLPEGARDFVAERLGQPVSA